MRGPDEFQYMAAAEGHHWWYRTLHQLVLSAVARHPQGCEARILDAGCGTGGLLRVLAGHGYRHCSGIDVSDIAVGICRERGLTVEHRDLRELGSTMEGASFEVIVSNDTLYFFPSETQGRIVANCFRLLAPGGLLILNLPALACFRGLHDRAVGIQRRFTRHDVSRLLIPTGFVPRQVRFWPFVLSPGIWAVRFAQRVGMSMGTRKPRSDVRMPRPWLNACLARVTAVEMAQMAAPPFGSSLFVVAKKPGGAQPSR